jgi:HSP20 family protein
MLSRSNASSPGLPVGEWRRPLLDGGISELMDRLFEEYETSFQGAPATAVPTAPGPQAQLRDLGEAVSMLVDLPGRSLEDLDLSIEGKTVNLRVAAAQNVVPEGFTLIHGERNPRRVEWSFELPYDIDTGAASAVLEQGRLCVMLPKASEAKPRRIAVKGV